MNMPHLHMPHPHMPRSVHLPKAPTGAAERLSKIEAPEFLVDLYRDLRNRRLLPVAVALIVAIVAVPVVLTSASTTTPRRRRPPPSSPIRRLGRPPSPSPTASARSARATSAPPRTPSASRPRSSTSPPRSSVSAPATGLQSTVGSELGLTGTGGGSGGGSTSGGSGSGSTGSVTDISGSGKTLTKLTNWAVNLQVGESGSNLDSRKDVGPVGFLPSESKPVFVFVGVSQTGAKAFFCCPARSRSTATPPACCPSSRPAAS